VSREATSSSDKEVSSDDAAHYVQDGVRGGNKRRKQRPLGTVATSSHDDDHGWEAGSPNMGRIAATTCGGRCLIRTPSNHFKRLLEEARPNHTYPIRHKIKGCGMMQSFMTSRSLTYGVDLDEGPDESGATLFPEENTIMTVFEGHPLFFWGGGRRMSSLGPRISTHGGWAVRAQGRNCASSLLHSSNIY
jgi:hypothetical protein